MSSWRDAVAAIKRGRNAGIVPGCDPEQFDEIGGGNPEVLPYERVVPVFPVIPGIRQVTLQESLSPYVRPIGRISERVNEDAPGEPGKTGNTARDRSEQVATSLPVWHAGIARLGAQARVPQWPKDRWRQLMSDASAFLAEWGEAAAMLGWTTYELFGVHCRAPYARLDALGLVPLLNGSRVTELSATRAVIRLESGGELTYRRKPQTHWPREAERALVWDDGVGVDDLRGWLGLPAGLAA
jgi:hypothetical protein